MHCCTVCVCVPVEFESINPSVCVQVKVAYVNFVNHCYVDTEVEMKEIYTSNHIWKLFEDFTVDMARVSVLHELTHTHTRTRGGVAFPSPSQ